MVFTKRLLAEPCSKWLLVPQTVLCTVTYGIWLCPLHVLLAFWRLNVTNIYNSWQFYVPPYIIVLCKRKKKKEKQQILRTVWKIWASLQRFYRACASVFSTSYQLTIHSETTLWAPRKKKNSNYSLAITCTKRLILSNCINSIQH